MIKAADSKPIEMILYGQQQLEDGEHQPAIPWDPGQAVDGAEAAGTQEP
jgi:hypothetical protein